ncbi:Tfp pilus assembly protein PilO [Caldicoprobacter guelmensis]|uniref:hypothetical protein n=1 Tax=Caldicoprobacter guelmensis TaxID=1170224 RepID=UPI0019568F93|nr:hypothetical protein [Caldicoprobacter guelmensis]MBM7581274.1 Tfp pilus assembly protein PilO [Caldicoprobacter guelmensis]
MTQLTNREKIFIIIFVAILIISVYYVYFYQPVVKDIEAMSVQVKEAEDLPMLIKSKKEQLTNLQHEYQELSTKVSETLESLQWLDDHPGLVVHLYGIFSTRSKREQIEFGDMEQHTDFCVMPVNVTFTASYDDFKDILVQLEKSPYKNHIQALNVQVLEGGSAVSVNMSLRFYFKPEPAREKLKYPFVDEGKYGRGNPFQFPGQ